MTTRIARVGCQTVDGNIDNTASDYLTLNASHGLLAAHNLVTRHNKTCLDHVFLKTKLKARTIVIDSTVTDHNAVLLTLEKVKIDNAHKTLNKTDYVELENHLKNSELSYIYECTDANVALKYFIDIVARAIQLSTSAYSVPHRLKITKPWITPGVLRCMRNRDRMYLKMKKSPNNDAIKITYKRYRNYCSNILKSLKRQYERKELNKASTNPKKMWQVIRDVTNTNKTKVTASPLLKINGSIDDSLAEINKFFTTIGQNIANKVSQTYANIPSTSDITVSDVASDSLVFLQTDELEVEQMILDLRTDCATGIDGISAKLIKQFKSIFVPPLTYIFNLCINAGVFPDLFKRALIHPIYKTGDVDRVNNYRPISVLPSLSKILEKIINTRLKKYLEEKDIISINQYGFRSNRSTNDAVHELTENIVQALDRRKKSLAIFLDLAKAFDTVSIPKLILKLERIGVRDQQLNLFISYLTNRTQCVKIGRYVSRELPIEYGVPQGSILGPTLFLVYINEMCKLKLTNGKLLAFADDTTLIFTSQTWEEVYDAAQTGFNRITKWLAENTLAINVDKTKIIRFQIKKNSIPNRFSITAHNHTTCCYLTCNCPQLQDVATIRTKNPENSLLCLVPVLVGVLYLIMGWCSKD
ncbi:unnamed protein product [Arctia plantaginis]|uniref:Reverse transcriptase domain-containing protein n=1 Tax=Arctia plantaginis TaxID=874455 RepID=A0A8S0Z9N9_ARCPL|nr:unnamed protein product [Arctia plantaginis]